MLWQGLRIEGQLLVFAGNANLAEPLDTGQALLHVIHADSSPSLVFLA
jgi:hypothetical protein